MSTGLDLLERPQRDLAADELWRRSLARSRERRALAAAGARGPRSLISAAIPDLDAPAEYRALASSLERDLSDEELWHLSLACARAKRLAAEKGMLQQARAASAPLVVAAVAALAPPQGGAHPRATTAKAAATETLLKIGSRGASVKAVQRALGITADGIFGPQTHRAVRAFQERNALLVDGIVGPQTRAALARERNGGVKLIRAWWVAPVQRALGVAVDGIYGPQTRAAVRAFQARNRLVVDGIVGPQTLRALGLRGGGRSNGHKHGGGGSSNVQAGPESVTRALWDELSLAKRMGLRLVSGHRPGATIGGGGNLSDHSYYPSRAIDVAGSAANMRRFALAIAGRSRVNYVIYSPLGMWGSWNGGWRPVTGGTRASHYSHVHVSAAV